MFIIHKNGNKTSKQPILKSNYTSFMFNNIFCEMNGKKLSTAWWGGNFWEMGEPSKLLLGSVILVLDIQVSILLGYPSNNCTIMPSIGS